MKAKYPRFYLFEGRFYKNCKACKFKNGCSDKKNGEKFCKKFRPKN